MKRYLCAALLGLTIAGCASPSATSSTTTLPAPLVNLALSPDGLGDVSFGLDPDTVIDDIAALVGDPDLDTDWIPSEPNVYGSCPGSSMRAIGWGSLVTIFIDDGTSDLGGYFYTYTYGFDYAENEGGIDPRGLDLTTNEGVGLGTTVAGLRDAFGDDAVIEGDSTLDVWSFHADAAGFRGLLSGPNDDDTVTLLQPLEGCT
jgi:hypothetical protein